MQAHVIVDTHTGEISVEGYEAHQLHPDCADCRAALARRDQPLFPVPDDLNDEDLEETSIRMRPRWRRRRP
ncbi:MAG: hypothetical protein KIT31_16835 [Deltaproteobacteria bacterium]|nr:hypothetical protein [Deltaproteobacteria bacterium]